MAKRSEFAIAEAQLDVRDKCMYCERDAQYTAHEVEYVGEYPHNVGQPRKVCRAHAEQLAEERAECYCSPARFQFLQLRA